MKVILKKIPLYESFDFNTEEDENFDVIIESHRYKKFLEENYIIIGQVRPYKKDGILFVNIDGDIMVKNIHITSLTNGLFCFGKVKGSFDCSNCYSLKSLEGAPKEVGEDFNCFKCEFLTSLEGAPEKVGRYFDCAKCISLMSLKGAPKEVGGSFSCDNCKSLTSLEGAPEKIVGDFYCFSCKSLTSLKGAPKEVGGDFDCIFCSSLKSIDLPTTTTIKGKILS